LGAKEAEKPESFKEWGIKGPFEFYTLYIQNKLQSKNANRREAFMSKTYRNPWTRG